MVFKKTKGLKRMTKKLNVVWDVFQQLSGKNGPVNNLGEKDLEIESQVEEAAKLFSNFLQTNDYTQIKKSAKLFLEILQKKPDSIDSYIYMAAMFFIFEQYENTLNYIRTAEKIDMNNPLLTDLKKFIGKNL
jgi:hypothetical protein